MQSFLSLWGIWTYFFSLLAVVALSVSSVWLFCDPTDCSLPGSSVRGFPGKKTGVGCHRLLQEIFLTQGANLHLLHWQASSLPLSRQGGPSAYSCASDAQSCLTTLCSTMDCNLTGSSVHGILLARMLEWGAGSSWRRSSWPRDQTRLFYVSCIGSGFFTTGTPSAYLLDCKTWEGKHFKFGGS